MRAAASQLPRCGSTTTTPRPPEVARARLSTPSTVMVDRSRVIREGRTQNDSAQ